MHGVGRDAPPLRHLRDEIVVPAAKERERQHPADDLTVKAAEEAGVGEGGIGDTVDEAWGAGWWLAVE